MLYRKDRYGNQLSQLGFGCMRFPKTPSGQVDLKKSEDLVLQAHRLGVNYFGTAYVYNGIEKALGDILSRNPGLREEIHIATKLPHYLVHSISQADKFFDTELKRLQTDYIDYYLMHMLTDIGSWEKMVDLGIIPWLEEKKRKGQIRQIGFSFHGSSDAFIKVLNAYDWDFCQIQYNYMDEYSQAGRRGLEAAQAKGIPVIIMEPLRGGRLVNLLPQQAKDAFAQPKHGENGTVWSPAEWGLRWLWDQSGVTVILSGMNTPDMVDENCRIASQVQPGCLTEEDRDIYQAVKDVVNKSLRVPCTGCGYCMPCPHGVDIPGIFHAWNAMYTESKKSGRREYMQLTTMRHKQSGVSSCVRCGACEIKCPQSIPIRQKLQEAKKDLETPTYKVVKAGVKLLKMW